MSSCILFNAISSGGERDLVIMQTACSKRNNRQQKYLEAILEKMKQKNLSINNISIMIEQENQSLSRIQKDKIIIVKNLSLNEGK